jgi:hypothetical protein
LLVPERVSHLMTIGETIELAALCSDHAGAL